MLSYSFNSAHDSDSWVSNLDLTGFDSASRDDKEALASRNLSSNLSIVQQPQAQHPIMTSNPDVLPITGYVETTVNALRLIHAARQGVIPRITRRLNESECRSMIKSGAVFVFSVEESGIKRWTGESQLHSNNTHEQPLTLQRRLQTGCGGPHPALLATFLSVQHPRFRSKAKVSVGLPRDQREDK